MKPNQPSETLVVEGPRPAPPSRRDALLVHIYPTGPGMGRRFNLVDQPLTVGRDPDCDVCLNDTSVSRRHARVEPDGGGWRIVDLGSTNGTEVNSRSAPAHALRDGDYVRVGQTILRFLMGGNVEAEYYEEIYRLTIIDALTNIPNKRFLMQTLEHELTRSERHRRPLALVLFDLDHFKRVNDDLGHLAGDFTLREVAACVQRTVRKGEVFARYGGEEFAVVLPETTRQGAKEAAERVRAAVAALRVHFDGHVIPVTISLGVTATAGDPPLTPLALIGQADENLYKAKNAGRNCVVG